MSTPDQLPPPELTATAAPGVAAPVAEAAAATVEPVAPVMPAARSNRLPQLAGAEAQIYVPAPAGRSRRSRTRVYGIGAALFLAISIVGYVGFRSYIYGDDAPPVPVLDDLGG